MPMDSAARPKLRCWSSATANSSRRKSIMFCMHHSMANIALDIIYALGHTLRPARPGLCPGRQRKTPGDRAHEHHPIARLHSGRLLRPFLRGLGPDGIPSIEAGDGGDQGRQPEGPAEPAVRRQGGLRGRQARLHRRPRNAHDQECDKGSGLGPRAVQDVHRRRQAGAGHGQSEPVAQRPAQHAARPVQGARTASTRCAATTSRTSPSSRATPAGSSSTR